jgi:hypothetical protein
MFKFLSLPFLTSLKFIQDILGKILLPLLNLGAKRVSQNQEYGFEAISTEDNKKQNGDIITQEIKSESWLQRSWRPLLMLAIVLIIVNTYIVIPYLEIILKMPIPVILPSALFDLLIIGVGGYVIGRSFEKGIRDWRNPDK